MARSVSVTKALTDYFNSGDGKRPSKEWLGELKALSVGEKLELALLVCEATGQTLATSTL